jgi:hypothetical protein
MVFLSDVYFLYGLGYGCGYTVILEDKECYEIEECGPYYRLKRR